MKIYSLLLFAIAAMAITAPHYLFFEPTPAISSFYAQAPVTTINCLEPKDNSIVPLLSEKQKAFLDMPHDERVKAFADKKFRSELVKETSCPQAVTLKWSAAANATTYTVCISENQDMSDAVCVEMLPGDKTDLKLNNLKIAQPYYWQVFALSINNSVLSQSPVASFTTEDHAPRLINLKRVTNVRDIGGRIGLNGRRVKQGMIYRNIGMNSNASKKKITMDELVTLHPDLIDRKNAFEAEVTALEKDGTRTDIEYLPFLLSKTWTFYRPNMLSATRKNIDDFMGMTSIPDSYLGAKKETRGTDQNGHLSMSLKEAMRPAFFIQEFTAEKAGIMQIGFGGDWWWALAVNGKVYCDNSNRNRGNEIKPICQDNYVMDVEVKAGKNIITIYVGSGSEGWGFWCDAPSNPVSHNQAVQTQITSLKNAFEDSMPTSDLFSPGESRLNPEIYKYMLDILGIRSDIDLRGDQEVACMTGSPLGPRCNWYNVSSSAYYGMHSPWGKEQFAKVFRIFLNESNYPIDFHCIAGQDRTGAVAFIINGLLGVSLEELYLDWEATGFLNPSPEFNHQRCFDELIRVFEQYPGENYCEKCESYVLSIGFTKYEIEKFRRIMLE